MGIFVIFLCVPLFAVNSFCDKYASEYHNQANNFKYNACKFFVGSLILLPLFLLNNPQNIEIGSVICGILCGLMYTINKTFILRGYQKTSVSFMTLSHAAGMLIPCIIGHFFWNEKITLISLTGMIVTVIAIMLIKNKKTENGARGGLLIGIFVFLSSGGVMVLQKIMGLYFPKDNISAYNFYSFVIPAAIMLLFSFMTNKGKNTAKISKKVFLSAIGSSVSLCVISLVMTSLAGKIPSEILFPFFNGTGIIAVCVGSVFVFKERINALQILGIFLAILGMCLVNF